LAVILQVAAQTSASGKEEAQTDARSAYRARSRLREALSLQLLMRLDSAQMASIKAQFQAHGNAVDMQGFCAIMEAHLPAADDAVAAAAAGSSSGGSAPGAPSFTVQGLDASGEDSAPVSRREVVANLAELFREVDINGDGSMEW
jgi:hypothetical protein